MDFPVVEISDGKIKGCKRITMDGEEFFSFLGIPYGKPPVGQLRFKLPQQNSLLKPVMAWIHGGAFIMGSSDSNSAGPKFLMTEDIVLVTIHYRIGFLGFLSLEDTSLGVPGNAGLKDQTLALKWVQKNIKNFGGDPDNVTIFGESAGGVLAHYHILSEQSKGLFHKAILQSGTALNPWTFGQRHGDFLKSLKKGLKSEKEALGYFTSLSPQEICLRQVKFLNGEIGGIAPVIEKPNETAFLTEKPIDVISSGNYNKVPLIMGYCSNEGLLFEGVPTLGISSANLISNKNRNWKCMEHFVVTYLKIEKGSERCTTLCKILADHYFQGKNATDKYLFPSDYNFVAGVIGSAKLHSSTSGNPVYLYRMSLVTRLNAVKFLIGLGDRPGACHGDDLGYLFSSRNTSNMQLTEKEKIGIKRFVKLWTNFAKYGNPTPTDNDLKIQWKPIESDDVHLLDIGDELVLHNDPEQGKIRVWREVFQHSSHTSQLM